MSAGTSEFFCLICLLVCSCTAQEIIRHEKITAELGQDVILPCKVPNNNNIKAVEWSRPGLDPEYVIFYWNGHFDPDNQHPSYQNRVDLQDKEMKDGDVSLILKDVKMEDRGTYECRVKMERMNEPINIIYLKVGPSAQEIITAERGQNKVILPCKAPNKDNNNIAAVQWNRPELDSNYVLLYRDGRIDPVSQHPSYQNRVDLQDKEMKDGDVSLILKNVKMEDTGIYKCRVFEKEKNELISIIYLEVHPSGKRDESTGDEGDKTGIIVGSVVGVILLLAAFGSVGFLIYRRHMKKNPNLPIPPDVEAVEQML